jgi:hypothetical protein
MTGSSAPLPMRLDIALRRELAAGERILWSAQPMAKRLKSGFGVWIFAIPWTVFSLFFVSLTLMPWADSTHTPAGIKWSFGLFMPLFGLPFVLVGFAMLWGPIKAMRETVRTAYGLTSLRLIRVVEARRRRVDSVLLSQIGPMQRSENKDGTGHLRIQTHSRIDSDGDRITEKFEVLGVPDVARLERLILENQPRGAA